MRQPGALQACSSKRSRSGGGYPMFSLKAGGRPTLRLWTITRHGWTFARPTVNGSSMTLSDPWDAGVEPWQMLGFLRSMLEHTGTITPEQWQAAIDSQRKAA